LPLLSPRPRRPLLPALIPAARRPAQCRHRTRRRPRTRAAWPGAVTATALARTGTRHRIATVADSGHAPPGAVPLPIPAARRRRHRAPAPTPAARRSAQ
jgi:hypothetical protein